MIAAKTTSRRQFLGQTALLAGGTALAGTSITRAAHAAGSDVLRFALVGCGSRGGGAAGNLLDLDENIKLVALADAFAEPAATTREALKKRYPGKVDVTPERVFVGLDAYQKAIACGVDLVIFATPPGFRPTQYRAAVEAGKHVFMEKDCCTDAPGFRSVMETNRLADQKGLKVGVGFQRRHAASYIQNVREVQDGQIGEVLLLRTCSNGGGVPGRPRKPGQSEMEHQLRNWSNFVWLGGDSILFFHVHNLDVANWVKQDHPVEASGMGGRQANTGPQFGQVYDHHYVEFTYQDGTKLFSQCRQIAGCWNNVEEYVHGTKGSRNLAAAPRRPIGSGASNNPYVQQYVDLIRAIRKGEKYNEGWHGATSSFTAILGRMATYSGQVVRWDEAVAKGPDEMPDELSWKARPKCLPDATGNYPVAVPGAYRPY